MSYRLYKKVLQYMIPKQNLKLYLMIWIFNKSKYNSTLKFTVDILHFRERTRRPWRGTCLFTSPQRVWPSCGPPISWWMGVVRTRMMKSIAGKQSNQHTSFLLHVVNIIGTAIYVCILSRKSYFILTKFSSAWSR